MTPEERIQEGASCSDKSHLEFFLSQWDPKRYETYSTFCQKCGERIEPKITGCKRGIGHD